MASVGVSDPQRQDVRELPLLAARELGSSADGLSAALRPSRGPASEASAAASAPAAEGVRLQRTTSISSSVPSSVPRSEPSLAQHFNYEPPVLRPLPAVLTWILERLFGIFLFTVFGGSLVVLVATYFGLGERDDHIFILPCPKAWTTLVKYLSIPLVSLLFTWWHVWVGIKMCFYPVEFRGLKPPYLGWQGIVPRRAHIMASRSCDMMIGNLITVEEIVDRIEPEGFFNSLEPALVATMSAVMERLAQLHMAQAWRMVPTWCKNEIREKVLEESHLMFVPVLTDLKSNINEILDIKQMAVDVLVENRALLVNMFEDIGRTEFAFIQHVGAVMGFCLGCLQMFLWLLALDSNGDECVSGGSHQFHCWGGYVVLPLSGLIIGYLTNWLAIYMIFRPVEPHLVCGGYLNLQGVFLKRQQEVSQELASMISTHLVRARRMVEFILRRDDVVKSVLGIYELHLCNVIDNCLGKAKVVLPKLFGSETIASVKQDVIRETLAELPTHSREIEAYMDRAFGLRDTLAYRLSRLPPDRFEGMLHPVFQEDEWMVLLLGGVLGVAVGLLQAVALGL